MGGWNFSRNKACETNTTQPTVNGTFPVANFVKPILPQCLELVSQKMQLQLFNLWSSAYQCSRVQTLIQTFQNALLYLPGGGPGVVLDQPGQQLHLPRKEEGLGIAREPGCEGNPFNFL